ncbi:MAG: hypothetical protein GOVbin2937_65 [Prokaryotic dsDNA virus sp.]|nr:MAG: hypothetical protein GOVbin2937_65 [Prokaryotic dsDNA virus sp.]
MTTRQCRYCCTIFSADECPTCAEVHASGKRTHPPHFIPKDGGTKRGAVSLDVQEGNWEEWR